MSMIPSMSKKRTTPPPQKRRLNVEKLYEAASLAESALPEMVKNLIGQFDDPELSVKERVMILRALQSTTLQKPRMEDAEGLLKRNTGAQTNPLLALGNVKIEMLVNLPPEKQEEFLLDTLKGKQPKVLDVKADDVE